MGRPKLGELKYDRKRIVGLADEMIKWLMDNPNEWDLRNFSMQKGIPFERYMGKNGIFAKTENYWTEKLELALDISQSRFVRAVGKDGVPPQFGIFASKNMFGWKDNSELKHSGKVSMQPTKEGLAEAFKKAFPKKAGKD